jgi:hypothetical protein
LSWQALAVVQPMTGLAGSEKYILWMLAYHHNDESGQCNPSLSFLEKETCLTRNTVIAILKSLEEKGYIAVRRVPQQSNQYDLIFLVSSATSATTAPASATTAPEQKRTELKVNPDTGEILTTLKEGEFEGEKTLRKRRSTAVKEILSPEVIAAAEVWRESGYPELSLRGISRLKALVAEHDSEIVSEAIRKADAQNIANPMAWIERVVPAWKRERARGTQSGNRDAPTKTQGRYDHLIRR